MEGVAARVGSAGSELNGRSSIRTLANRLKSRPYSKDVLDGFLIDRLRDDLLQARLSNGFTTPKQLPIHLGSITATERIEYRQHSFAAHASSPRLARATSVTFGHLAGEHRATLSPTSSGTARCKSTGDDDLPRALRAALIQAAIHRSRV